MASLIARLWTRLITKRAPLSIMIVGLDNSGKTSVLNKLASLDSLGNPTNYNQQQSTKLSQDTSSASSSNNNDNETNSGNSFGKDKPASTVLQSCNIVPTVGYNYERIQYKGLTITVLDFSGQNRYRNLWQEFYNGVDAIVFVIDSSDIIRFVVVRDEIETMLSHPYFVTLQQHEQQQNHNDIQQQIDIKREQLYPSSNAAMFPQKQITVSQGKLIQTVIDTPNVLHPASSLSAFSTNLKTSSNQTVNSSVVSKKSRLSSSSSRRRFKVPILFLANKTDLPNSVDAEVITKALNLNELPQDRHPWSIQATSINLNQGITEGFDWLIRQLST